MILIDGFLLLLAIGTLIPVSVFTLQVASATLSRKDPIAPSAIAKHPSVCVLMPAHNEAGGIADVLRALLPQLGSNTELVVVADNCTDGTADIAREVVAHHSGVHVIERFDADRRGKGYALDFGLRHIEKAPPEVILILDSDCELSSGAIARLSSLCVSLNRPVQALYLMYAPLGATVKTRLAEFAWLVKNHVRALGYSRLGLPCQLMGTGMAFTWGQICTAKLNNQHIVEDLKLGIDLARAGTPPLFCSDTLVTSYFPISKEGLQEQRTRWEHGHLGVILAEVPGLLKESVKNGSLELLAFALDLSVPPLALITVLISSQVLVSGAWMAFGGASSPFLISFLAAALLVFSVLSAWHFFGRKAIPFTQLISIPFYIVSKIPLYLRFLVRRQVEWVRSKRDS